MSSMDAPVIFLAELFLRSAYPPELAIAADDMDRAYNIYFFDTAKPANYENTYWSNWGGNYDDLIENVDVQLLMGLFLIKVNSAAELKSTENSFYTSGTFIYMNIAYKPWQYATTETEVETLTGFSSAPKDPNNPSDTLFSGVNYPVRLKVPSITNKLSDAVSGLALFLAWSFTLSNNDGHFDNTDENNFFNIPVQLLKSTVINPERTDFDIIRSGFVDDQKTTFNDFTVKSIDYLRSLEQEVTDPFTVTEFANLPDKTLDKKKPLIWGDRDGLPLFEVHTNGQEFYAGDNITAVATVYDRDGVSLSFSFSAVTGIITETTGAADSADVTGSADNTIGEIIIEIIIAKTILQFIETFWDLDETQRYIDTSKEVAFYFTGGSVKKFVTDILKNDNAFLIQKNRGVLTLRKWGEEYTTHDIANWRVMQKPGKDHSSGQSNYMSSSLVEYKKNEKSGIFGKSFIYDTEEATIFEEFRKKRQGGYKVQLSNDADAEQLAEDFVSRFGKVPETLDVSVGYNTADIELLDFVQLPMQINGRRFSEKIGWIVKAVNPAQDKLSLEANEFYDKEFQDGRAALNNIDDQRDAAFDFAASTTGIFRTEQ